MPGRPTRTRRSCSSLVCVRFWGRKGNWTGSVAEQGQGKLLGQGAAALTDTCAGTGPGSQRSRSDSRKEHTLVNTTSFAFAFAARARLCYTKLHGLLHFYLLEGTHMMSNFSSTSQ